MKIDYNPLNDVLFKFIFGAEERKHITIDFLNAVLDKNIREIEFQNVEFIPKREEEKLSRIDVFAILDNNERVDIEVQCVNYFNIEKRSLFYWANMFLHNKSLLTAQNYSEIKPAITVNILDYKFLPQENPHSKYCLYNLETQHKLTDVIELNFLEVPKFRKKKISEMNKVERWLGFLSKKLNLVEKEELAMSEQAIQDAMTAADTFFMDDEKYWEYLNRQAAVWDYNSAHASGVEKGIEKNLLENLKAIMKNLQVSAEKAMDILDISQDKRDFYLSKLN